jgi:hypothetical protein
MFLFGAGPASALVSAARGDMIYTETDIDTGR